MKKLWLYFASFPVFFLCSLTVRAQGGFTTVTGTVKDPAGITWACGTISAQLITAGGAAPTLNGGGFTTQTSPVQLGCPTIPGSGASGSFVMRLADSGVISPSNTTWRFTVGTTGTPPPLGTGPQSFTYTTAINCSTNTPTTCTSNQLDISTPISALAPAIGAGGGVSPNSPSPVNLFNVKNYGAIGDAKKAFRAVTANGSAHITDTLDFNPWVAGDVNKKIFCTMNGGANVGQNPLNLTIATITAVNSATDITVNTTGNGVAASSTECVWYTKDDTAAFCCVVGSAADAAGSNIATAAFKGFSEYTAIGTVYCPNGGYVVSGPVLDQQGGNPYTLGVNFVGEGRAACRIYPTPNVSAAHNGIIMSLVQTGGQRISGFSVDCGFAIYSIANAAGFNFTSMQHAILSDIEVDSCGNTAGSTPGMFSWNGATNVIVDGVTVNGTSFGSSTAAFSVGGGQVFHMRNVNTTNPGQIPLTISSSGGSSSGVRSNTNAGVIVENSTFDEGGATAAIRIGSNSNVNLIGVGAFDGATSAITVDGTSTVYLTDSNLVPFGGACSGGNRQGLVLASGGTAYVTGTTISGCGADGTGLSAAVSGPAGANYFDLGGNDYRNCPGGPPCPLVTIAQFPTRGFNGGVTPIFPLPYGSTTQLGGRQTVSGAVPTGCTITGNGTSTCAFDTGSTDAAGRITITAAGTTTAVGLVSFSFSSTLGTNSTSCAANYLSGTGTWAIGAVAPIFITNTTAGASFNINNNAVNLTATSTYKVNYTCYGQ